MGEITMATWLFIGLIVTNIFTLLLFVLIINGICYLHDMIKVSIDMRKEKKKNGNDKNKEERV